MKNVGTIKGGVVTPQQFGIKPITDSPIRTTDAAIANGNAMLISELEKRDTLIREPLTSVTYARDIPIKTGGGWVEFLSSLNIDYGVTGGSDNGLVSVALREYDVDINFSKIRLPEKHKKIKELIHPEVIMDIIKDTNIELPVLLAMWLSFSASNTRAEKVNVNTGRIYNDT